MTQSKIDPDNMATMSFKALASKVKEARKKGDEKLTIKLMIHATKFSIRKQMQL